MRVATAEFQRLRLSLERLGMILSRINKEEASNQRNCIKIVHVGRGFTKAERLIDTAKGKEENT